MFDKILIANRGEILHRVVRTAHRMGIATVAAYSEADRFTAGVLEATEAVCIGPAPAAQSYLNIDAVLGAAKATGAQAVHPGYGFLSESAHFAEALARENIAFIGPRPEHLRAFGLKHRALELALAAQLPILPGSDIIADPDALAEAALRIGYPVMLKSSAGGGGIGMVLCEDEAALRTHFASVSRMAAQNFGNAALFVERYVAHARHVEVQIFGNGAGDVVTLGERDCSLQRRNQKIIEEAPAPHLPAKIRSILHQSAARLARTVNYESAGTVEFIYDAAREELYFLEVNTRLQVEHGVTEAIFGVDLVEWMIRQADGSFILPSQENLQPSGSAIEARIYAEDPGAGFRPCSGMITSCDFPADVRIDGWVERGTEVTAFYDPLLAKMIATGGDRDAAIAALHRGLADSYIGGIGHNLDYLRQVLTLPDFAAGTMTTRSLSMFQWQPRRIEVLDPGAQSSLQDWPGRLGYWEVGVPPSGPMDERSFRLVNMIAGNQEGATALEMTMAGPRLRFACAAEIVLGGALMNASLDGEPVGYWEKIEVRPGQILTLGSTEGTGRRAYLAVRGGFEAPSFLGSASCFSLGGFGGQGVGVLQTGDHLAIGHDAPVDYSVLPPRPSLTKDWVLDVRYGPHGAPDFFQPSDIDTLFSHAYEVHHNSARTGVRLIGPKPAWARRDGGEAGLHPSNIHDNAYAVGAVDFTGDMPILLGPDGPSLGGFVCPAVVTQDDLWKLGQLAPGDRVRFNRKMPQEPAILARSDDRSVCYRRAGEANILVEFGDMELDFAQRLRAQALRDRLAAERIAGLSDLTPGIRSLQIHFDPSVISQSTVLDHVMRLQTEMPDPWDMVIPSRIVHLPLSWNDREIQLAARKYQELVRPDAPWCPSNIEFIRRINGLDTEADVKRIIFDASYLVLGLGDVYLGAPVATPIDPRHRLVTTKYNPARTWTPQNAVGIGGAYMCVYGMEGPGGYQLFGRTIQVWNSWRQSSVFEADKPWLLRHFDQIRFFEVSEAELAEARAAFPHGRYQIKIEECVFTLKAHRDLLASHRSEIESFRARQQAAFRAERDAWAAAGLDRFEPDPPAAAPSVRSVAGHESSVAATVPGSVWQVLVHQGQRVTVGEDLMIIESMKMEVRVTSPASGIIADIFASPGQVVRAGQLVAVIDMAA
jgi:urea carboxylase